MGHIRRAVSGDLNRIAEIEVFCYRLNFYPIFQEDAFYFDEFQVVNRAAAHSEHLGELLVYDDGVIKGFVQVSEGEVKKLFVEPVLHGRGIGAALLEHAVEAGHARFLWALEKNPRAIAFYRRHGFRTTGLRKPEEGTTEHLVHMER